MHPVDDAAAEFTDSFHRRLKELQAMRAQYLSHVTGTAVPAVSQEHAMMLWRRISDSLGWLATEYPCTLLGLIR